MKNPKKDSCIAVRFPNEYGQIVNLASVESYDTNCVVVDRLKKYSNLIRDSSSVTPDGMAEVFIITLCKHN